MFLLLVIAVVVGATWHWRLTLAELLLPSALERAGIELAAVTVTRLDFDGADLNGVHLGPSGTQFIAGLDIEWSIRELLDRRVRTVGVTGADLRVGIGADGKPVFEGLSLPQGKDRGAGGLIFPKNLPFDRINVEQSRISVALPDGQAEIGFDASVEVSKGSLTGDVAATYSAETARGQGAGAGRASFEWSETKAPSVDVTLEFVRFVTAQATGTNIRINGSTDGVPARIQDLSFRADMRAATIETPQLIARDIDLAVELSAGALEIKGNGSALNWAVALSTRLHPFDLSAPARFTLSGKGGAAVIAERIESVAANGTATIEIVGEIGDPGALFGARDEIARRPSALAEHISGRLNLQTDIQQFGFVDKIQTGAIAGTVSARWAENILDVDVGESLLIESVKLAPPFKTKVAEFLPDASPFDLMVADGMGSPATVRFSKNNNAVDVRVIGGIDVTLPDGMIGLEADGRAVVSAVGLENMDIAALSAVSAGVRTKFGSATGDVLITDLSMDGQNVTGVAGGEVSISGVSIRGLSARHATLKVDGEFRATADEASLELSPGGSATARDLKVRGRNSLPGITRFQLGEGVHRFALNRRNGRVSLDTRLCPGEVKANSSRGGIGVSHGALAVSGTWPGRLNFSAKNVDVDLDAERRVSLDGVRARVEGKTSNAGIAISVSDAQPVVPGLTLPSFDATANLRRRGQSLDGEMEAIAAGGQPSVKVRGRHNLKSGKGEGQIVEARLRFAPGVLQPADINPALAGAMENVFATFLLQGPIAWAGAGDLTPNLTLTIDDLAASTDSLELSDAKATIMLTGAPAIETPPGQKFTGQLRVGRLEPVPLDVSFQLLPSQSGGAPRLVVERLEAQLTEGRMTTDRFTLTPPSIDTDVTLRLEGADLARAFKVIGVAGIGGTGKISGEIPVKVRGNQVAISGGRLANDGPGEVFYDIAALPQTLIDRDDTVTLVLEALSNFAYDELQADLDKALDGPGSLRLRLTGANPDVLENHPFIFNINLESNFDRLAALVLEGLTTSQGLLRALALSAGENVAPAELP
ncbi:MAG: hypothetical protein HKN28_08545 [Alphaproteobacteria bacterium]|nr:hypothetical protein [Alphaproteobacteria bacterium]